MTILFFIVSAAVLWMLIWTTLRGRDFFPFSHYPMFSNSADVSNVEVFRLALETKANKVYWWKSEFYRYPEYIGRQLQKLYQMAKESDKISPFITLKKHHYLFEVLRIIEIEDKTIDNLQSLRIIKRTIIRESGDLLINDEVIDVIAVSELIKSKSG